jgi:hypothetical protein
VIFHSYDSYVSLPEGILIELDGSENEQFICGSPNLNFWPIPICMGLPSGNQTLACWIIYYLVEWFSALASTIVQGPKPALITGHYIHPYHIIFYDPSFIPFWCLLSTIKPYIQLPLLSHEFTILLLPSGYV